MVFAQPSTRWGPCNLLGGRYHSLVNFTVGALLQGTTVFGADLVCTLIGSLSQQLLLSLSCPMLLRPQLALTSGVEHHSDQVLSSSKGTYRFVFIVTDMQIIDSSIQSTTHMRISSHASFWCEQPHRQLGS